MSENKQTNAESMMVGLAVVVGVAFVGFAVGISPTERIQKPLRDISVHQQAEGDVSPAPSYLDLRTTSRQSSSWTAEEARFRSTLPGVNDPVARTGDKAGLLVERASRRAYDGGPPTIPHPVRQASASECMACHEDGLRVGERTASVLSHQDYTSCTQCHVVEEAPMVAQQWLEGGPWSVPNHFEGLVPRGDGGERGHAIAPPMIPHQTFMRENCDACHGVAGADPIRTTHPYRQNCEQCHAPAAVLERRPGVEI